MRFLSQSGIGQVSALAVAVATFAVPVAAAHADEVKPAAIVLPGQGADAQADAQSDDAAGKAPRASDIVVTGSRVITNGNNSPSPVTVVTTDQLQTSTPQNIPDALNKLPVFASSSNQQSPINGGSNFTGNYLNLRSAGAQRTLILFDGHRFGPTTQSGLVDTNFIPQLLIQRVDVVTGGASAVYGSDAVTGVVNFIIDKKFTGVKAIAQAGISTYGDDGSQRLGLAVGTNLFGGRGHFEASYEYYNSDGIDSKLGRAWGRAVYSEQPSVAGSTARAGTAANPYALIANTRLSKTSFFGYIPDVAGNGPLRDMVFRQPGVLSPFQHGAALGTTGVESGGDGAYYDQASLVASLRSHQAFARFDYDVTDNISFYAMGSYASAFNQYYAQSNEFVNVTLSADNAFLPQQYRDALHAAGLNTFTFSKIDQDMPAYQPTATVTNWYFLGGLTGHFGGWNWDVGYSRTTSKQDVVNGNNRSNGRSAAALDAVVDPSTGNIVCNVTLTNPGLYPGCVPINLFGAQTVTQQMQDYILENTGYRLRQVQDDVSASISGSPFSTWAGPVRVALSGDWRHLKLDIDSTSSPTASLDCTGLRYNCKPATGSSSGTSLYASNVVASAHPPAQEVVEGALEVNIPLLSDMAFFKEFDVNGAVRRTHYNTSGSVTTWKLGIDWQVNDDLTFRATRSRDIRAPNLNDLYAPVSAGPVGYNDLHTGVTGVVISQSSGNPDLKPEIAQTLTIGAVFRPHWVRGLSIAVDYFQINVDNAIGRVRFLDSTTQAECENSNGASPLCALAVRPFPFTDHSAANFPTVILSQALNVATFRTKGVDAEVNYTTGLAGGQLSLRGLLTYQPDLLSRSIPSSPEVNQAGVAFPPGAPSGGPTVRITGFIHYANGGWSLDILERWHNATAQDPDPTVVYLTPDVPAAAYTDLTVTRDIQMGSAKMQVFLSAQNLFNKQFPIYAQVGGRAGVPGLFVTNANGDDPVGRYFTFGARLKF